MGGARTADVVEAAAWKKALDTEGALALGFFDRIMALPSAGGALCGAVEMCAVEMGFCWFDKAIGGGLPAAWMLTVLELERILATATGLVMLAADDEDVGAADVEVAFSFLMVSVGAILFGCAIAADVVDDTTVSRFLFPTSFLLAPV